MQNKQPIHTIALAIEYKNAHRRILFYIVAVSNEPIVKTFKTMKLEDIDQIFKDNERQFDKLPPEQVWHKLEQRLAQGQPTVAKTQSLFSKKSTWLYAAAAAIIILFLTPFTINLINKDASKSNEQIALLNNQATEAPTVSSTIDDSVTFSAKETITSEMAEKEEEPVKLKSESKPTGTFSAPNKDLNSLANANDNRNSATKTPEPSGAVVINNERSMRKEATAVEAISSAPADASAYIIQDDEDVMFSRYYLAFQDYESQREIIAPPSYNDAAASKAAPAGRAYDTEQSLSKEEKKSKKLTVSAKPSSQPKADVTDQVSDTKQINSLQQISWLWGTWKSRTDDIQITETWISTGNASISITQNKKQVFSETTGILPLNNTLIYTLKHPESNKNTAYPLSNQSSEKELIFENNSVSFPNRITYRLLSEDLLSITFADNENNPIVQKTILLYKNPETKK